MRLAEIIIRVRNLRTPRQLSKSGITGVPVFTPVSVDAYNEIRTAFRTITACQQQRVGPMRTSVSVVLSILIAGSTWSLAHGNPAYSVTGVAIGSRVDFDSTAYQEYRCDRSEMFDGLTFCTKRTDDTDQRGPFVAYDGLLHSRDGTVVYVSRYQDPAYFAATGICKPKGASRLPLRERGRAFPCVDESVPLGVGSSTLCTVIEYIRTVKREARGRLGSLTVR
jgi:hypothetical protein